MSARLVRSRKCHAVGLALAALMLCLASGAQAAVYTGSSTDRSGDLVLDVGDSLPSPRVDFTGVSVRYDDATGRLDASFSFNRAPAAGQRLDASVALGFTGAGGSCSTAEFRSRDWRWLDDAGTPRGQAAVTGESTGFAGSVRGVVWTPNPAAPGGFDTNSWTNTVAFDWPGSANRAFGFATANSLLAGRPYTCARAAMTLSGGGSGVGVDTLDGRFIGLGRIAASAQWVSPRDGQTVSGVLTEQGAGAQNCEARVTGPVARTANFVDGRLINTQNLAPWSCEWDTRNYTNGPHSLRVVAYNAAGREIASDTITVIVSNPSPPPVDSPPTPSVEPGPPSPPQRTTPTTPGGPPGPQDPVAFSRRRAGDAVKKILTRRYRRAFRNRRGFQLACVRASETRWTCAVRWRYGGLLYKGKIKLSLRPDGRIASQTVLRRLFR